MAKQVVVNGAVVNYPTPPGTRAQYLDLKLRFPDERDIVMVYEETQDRYYSFFDSAVQLRDFQYAHFYYNSNGQHGVWFDRPVWPSVSGYLIHRGLNPIYSDKL